MAQSKGSALSIAVVALSLGACGAGAKPPGQCGTWGNRGSSEVDGTSPQHVVFAAASTDSLPDASAPVDGGVFALDASPPDAKEACPPLSVRDREQIILLALKVALVNRRLPDVGLVSPNGGTTILSSDNLAGAPPTLAGIKLAIVSPAEIQARANRKGPVAYVHVRDFGSCPRSEELKWGPLEPSERVIEVTATFADPETSKPLIVGGGFLGIAVHQDATGRWLGRVLWAMVS